MKNIIAILTLLIAQGAYAGDKCFVEVELIKNGKIESTTKHKITEIINNARLFYILHQEEIRDEELGLSFEHGALVSIKNSIAQYLELELTTVLFKPRLMALNTIRTTVRKDNWKSIVYFNHPIDQRVYYSITVFNYCDFK